VQVFMGQSWADHNRDFMARALRADRITFADLGVVKAYRGQWVVENVSPESIAFAMTFTTQRVAS